MVRVTTESHVDLELQSLVGRSILGEPGYVAEERVTSTDDGLYDIALRPVKVTTSVLYSVCGFGSGFWLFGAGISYEMPPDALCQQLTVSMSRRRM